jgi:hypothetical protein
MRTKEHGETQLLLIAARIESSASDARNGVQTTNARAQFCRTAGMHGNNDPSVEPICNYVTASTADFCDNILFS